MTARDAARFLDGRASVPKHAGVRIFPVDRKRFVDLDVLASLYAAATKNALIGIVAIKRIGVIDFVGLRPKRNSLMLNGQQLRCVMNGAIAVVIVTDGAIKKMVAEDAIKRFHLSG